MEVYCLWLLGVLDLFGVDVFWELIVGVFGVMDVMGVMGVIGGREIDGLVGVGIIIFGEVDDNLVWFNVEDVVIRCLVECVKGFFLLFL